MRGWSVAPPSCARGGAAYLLTTLCLLAIGGCGGGERQDENEREGNFPVEVVEAKFPESQKLAMARHAQLWEPAMEHERILQAIERRDPDGAAYYMRTHITRAAGRAGVAILDIV